MNPFKVSAVTLIALVQYWVACWCSNNRPLGLIIALMHYTISITALTTALARLI